MKKNLKHLLITSCLILLSSSFILSGCSLSKKVDLGGYAICPTGTDIIILNPDGTEKTILSDVSLSFVLNDGGHYTSTSQGGVFSNDVQLFLYSSDGKNAGLYSVDTDSWIINLTSVSDKKIIHSQRFDLLITLQIGDYHYNLCDDNEQYKKNISGFDLDLFLSEHPEIDSSPYNKVYPLPNSYFVVDTYNQGLILCNSFGTVIHPEWEAKLLSYAAEDSAPKDFSLIRCCNYNSEEIFYYDIFKNSELMLPENCKQSLYKGNGFFVVKTVDEQFGIYDCILNEFSPLPAEITSVSSLSIISSSMYVWHDLLTYQSILYNEGLPIVTKDLGDLGSSYIDEGLSIAIVDGISSVYDRYGNLLFETDSDIRWINSHFICIKEGTSYKIIDYDNNLIKDLPI